MIQNDILTHQDSDGRVKMVDVGLKQPYVGAAKALRAPKSYG